MENLRYNVLDPKGEQAIKPTPLFTIQGIVILFGALVFIMISLYPGQTLINNLINQDYLSDVDYRYSIILLGKRSDVQLSWELIEESPQQVITTLLDAKSAFINESDPTNLWLSYIILRTLTLNPDIKSGDKKLGISAMLTYFNNLSQYPYLTIQQLKALAMDALAIGNAPWALNFYEHIIKLQSNQSVAFYGDASRAALWANECERSATLAFDAKNHASMLNDERYFFFLGIQSLFACQKYNLALDLAEQNIKGLTQDPVTYQLLADYALKAGQPKKAQFYIMQLLKIQGFTQAQ